MGTDELSRWRDALIVDKDDALIAAAKRWLGPVKTPFNKHELVARVESFLKRHDTTTAIIELLDRPDRRIVALSLFSGTIASGELVRLAAGDDISEAAALRRIHSLKERLVLYSFQDSTGVERYAVSPPLYEALQAALTPADALSVAIGTEEPAGLDPFASFCALVSAGTHAKPAFKGKLEPGKRAQAILDANAPGLAADKSRLEAMLGALIANGVAGYGADGRPVLYPQRFVELCDETGDTAPLILLSSCAANRAGGERVTPALMRAALEAMPRALAVSEHDVRRVVALATGNDLALPATVEAIAWTLIALGFFVRGDDSLYRASSAVDTALETPPDAAPGTAGRSIVVEESHEIRILPEAGYAARAFVSAIARLEGSGLVWSATLDKSAAKAAFAYGFRAADIAARLESLAGLPLPQSVRFSLDAWESESRSARVRVGVVVALDGHLSGVLEHSPRAANLVHERLAEGVYMLAARDALDAERLLKAAGIDVDIRLPPSDDAAIHRALWREHLASARLRIPIRRLDYSPDSRRAPGRALGRDDQDEPLLVGRLLSALDAIVTTPEERASLEERIQARLILDESQLRVTPVEPEHNLARAMDYPGKLRLLERALKDGTTVEVAHTENGGSQTILAGVPREIRRMSSGTVVSLSTDTEGQKTIAISAIDTLRTLRSPTNGV